jgi:hypothetical protein
METVSESDRNKATAVQMSGEALTCCKYWRSLSLFFLYCVIDKIDIRNSSGSRAEFLLHLVL